jgi:gliding motility-associated-like protein
VQVSGGTQFKNYPPYIYEWGGGFSQDTIVFGLCRGHYTLKVTDSLFCSIDTSYFVDALKSPKVDFEFLPRDTIYLTNPNVQVFFSDTARPYMTNWTFDFGDSTIIPNLNPSSHTYARTGTFPVRLKFTDTNGCDTVITHDLVVKVAELQITNLLTPNGDLSNDSFKIKMIDPGADPNIDFSEAYLSNEFVVFDRWGKKVFDKKGFKSEGWDGANLSDGTYFYILKCHGQYSDEVFKGSVTILREK